MDVPPGNTLPNPYSDNAAETGQPAFPWRGRITCSPAADYAGAVDKTATAAAQVSALFGAATPASFSVSGQSVSWTGTSGDWGLRRMVLHYAHLCAAAGGVDAFLIGTEMPGLTTIRSGASTYPAVQAYRDLLADVRSIPRVRDQDRLCGGLERVFRAPARRRLGRCVLPSRSALGRSGDRFRRHRQLHAAVGLARRVRASRCAGGLARDL